MHQIHLCFQRSRNGVGNQEEWDPCVWLAKEELLGLVQPPETSRGRFPAGVALRSSCSKWSCRDLRLLKLRLPRLRASGADSPLGAGMVWEGTDISCLLQQKQHSKWEHGRTWSSPIPRGNACPASSPDRKPRSFVQRLPGCAFVLNFVLNCVFSSLIKMGFLHPNCLLPTTTSPLPAPRKTNLKSSFGPRLLLQ